jgi:hypothetical protein
MHSWSTFDAQTSHRHTRTHKIHHGPNLGEATTFPLVVLSAIQHEATPKWCFSHDSQVESPKIPKFFEMPTL